MVNYEEYHFININKFFRYNQSLGIPFQWYFGGVQDPSSDVFDKLD